MFVEDLLRLLLPKSAEDDGDSVAIKELVTHLSLPDDLDPRLIATYAYLMARIAFADRQIDPSEERRIQEILQQLTSMPAAEAELIVKVATRLTRQRGGTENYLVTRDFKEHSNQDERQQLLHCLFAIAAADDSISLREEEEKRNYGTNPWGSFNAAKPRDTHVTDS